MTTRVQTNQSLSADCVIFGFNGETLKVLLVERRKYKPDLMFEKMKLPGAMIRQNETLPDAAKRILEEYTGISHIELKEVGIFSDPDRVSREELEWINQYHGIRSERVVTVGYYALLRLDDNIVAKTTLAGASWTDVDKVTHLAMDHMKILSSALDILYKEMLQSPIAFELLPRKFTMRSLQNLFSAVLGVELDSRNFRKKILSSGFIVPTGEKEKNVAHKPAQYYTFNEKDWRKATKIKMNFINNWKY